MERERKPLDDHITWTPGFCKHCFTCIHICPVKNLEFKGDDMISLRKCTRCELCMIYCPDFALEVEPKKKAESEKK
jgi:2-oxoglutarate ferredoxin oxidoreductase subunit delta